MTPCWARWAGCLHGALRASDTVARLGGDECAVLLPSAIAAARTLLSSLTEPVALEAGCDRGGQCGHRPVPRPRHGRGDAAALRRCRHVRSQARVAIMSSTTRRTNATYRAADAHRTPRRAGAHNTGQPPDRLLGDAGAGTRRPSARAALWGLHAASVPLKDAIFAVWTWHVASTASRAHRPHTVCPCRGRPGQRRAPSVVHR